MGCCAGRWIDVLQGSGRQQVASAWSEDPPTVLPSVPADTRPLAGLRLKASIIVLDAARANPFAQSGAPLAGGLALVEAEPGLRRAIGMLGQEFRLLNDRSIYENIALGCRISGLWEKEEIRQRVAPLLEEMGLRGMERLYSGELSAGEKQRWTRSWPSSRGPTAAA